MWLFLIGCIVIETGGLLAVLFSKYPHLAKGIAVSCIVVGSVLSAIPVISAIVGVSPEVLRAAWNLPVGEFNISLDPLSALFMLPVITLGPLTALYSTEYLKHPQGIGSHYFFYNTLIAAMMLLLTAQNAILFLIVWEIMAISSFFLVTFDDQLSSVREAGWTYLIATHIGVMALLAFFAILGQKTGDYNFNHFIESSHSLSPELATVLFGLSVVGFGSKAGIFPLHIWLPDAHPAAPSHVSALMSGVMIKMGIYGLFRSLAFIGAPPSEWGWTLVALGALASVVGIVYALSQHDLKRMLAYSSVENIGIICMGLGTGILGIAWQNSALSILGFGGAMLHVLNHSVFKGLLFLSAGTVVHETHSKEMNTLGGLLKKMPFTASLFFTGAIAASAIPPFNGFVSEFVLYFAGIKSALTHGIAPITLAAVLLTTLALVGGLAVAAFTKSAGLIFLGEPRVSLDVTPKDPGWRMKAPQLVLAVCAIALGVFSPYLLPFIEAAIQNYSPVMHGAPTPLYDVLQPSLQNIIIVFGLLLALFAVLAATVTILSGGRKSTSERRPVWDCGYARPEPSMQYTPSSYTAPIVNLFRAILRLKIVRIAPNGFFPDSGSFETIIKDRTRESFFAPLFKFAAKILLPFKILQHGHVHIYVIYVAVTLIALLFITAGN
ncbi:MAG: hypothetical protein JXX29_17820 [Deltaproteobacteria bacterium]|nr:hypothetical protein [Deltaproteobacteria bacterium]MBN2673544.1 hypothetical protein [Deltaproteobacteria bacterium]